MIFANGNPIIKWLRTELALRRVLKLIGKRSFRNNPLLYHRIVSTCGDAYWKHMGIPELDLILEEV